MRWLNSITDPVDHEFEQTPGIVKDRGAWCAAALGIAKSQTPHGQHTWTTATTG